MQELNHLAYFRGMKHIQTATCVDTNYDFPVMAIILLLFIQIYNGFCYLCTKV